MLNHVARWTCGGCGDVVFETPVAGDGLIHDSGRSLAVGRFLIDAIRAHALVCTKTRRERL